MLKKLTDEKQAEILEAGIIEFAEHGMQNASMSGIAKRAHISVGVLYKYYSDKEDFFLKCLNKSLTVLEKLVSDITADEDKPLNYARKLIEAVQKYSRENADYVRMYHEITTYGTEKTAAEMAKHIEGMTSQIYTEIVKRAVASGDIRGDIEPSFLAMFMDNLLMMMQFTYCCPYYRERYRLYRGNGINDEDEIVKEQLLKFLESAFTFESSKISHRK